MSNFEILALDPTTPQIRAPGAGDGYSVPRDMTVASGANLTLSGGTANGVLYLNGSKVATSGSALVFDGTNLGIGTSSPAAQLHIVGSDTTDQIIIENTDAGATAAPDMVFYRNSASPAANDALGNLVYRGKDSAGNTQDYARILSFIEDPTAATEDGNLVFQTALNASCDERMRITSAGEVLAGTTAALNWEGVTGGAVQTARTTFNPVIASTFAASTAYPLFVLAKSRSGTVGTYTYPNSGDRLGTLSFAGANTSDAAFNSGALIEGVANQTWTSTAQGSYLRFHTTADGSKGTTERMRITSAGDVGIGTASPNIGSLTGTVLTINGSVQSNLEMASAGASRARIASSSTDTTFETRVSASLVFGTNSTERMRITSAGEVLVGGTTSLIARTSVSIQHTNNDPILTFFRNDTTITLGNQLGRIVFYGNDTTSNTPTLHAAIDAVASGDHDPGDNPTDIVFTTTPDGTATAAEAGRITQAGSYVLKGGTTTAAAGVGVIFPATQVASANANSLDDYEEGTWSPVITDTTNNATMAAGTFGRYTKVGRLVTCQIYVETTSLGSIAAGAGFYISGWPFSIDKSGGGCFSTGAGLNITANQNVTLYPWSSTLMRFYKWDAAAGTSSMIASEWSADGAGFVTVSYEV